MPLIPTSDFILSAEIGCHKFYSASEFLPLPERESIVYFSAASRGYPSFSCEIFQVNFLWEKQFNTSYIIVRTFLPWYETHNEECIIQEFDASQTVHGRKERESSLFRSLWAPLQAPEQHVHWWPLQDRLLRRQGLYCMSLPLPPAKHFPICSFPWNPFFLPPPPPPAYRPLSVDVPPPKKRSRLLPQLVPQCRLHLCLEQRLQKPLPQHPPPVHPGSLRQREERLLPETLRQRFRHLHQGRSVQRLCPWGTRPLLPLMPRSRTTSPPFPTSS